MLNLLGSHDTERLLTRHGGDAAAAKLSYALLMAAEGAPMIYYGDEVGLVGDNDPGCRGTMPWDEATWNQDLLAHVRELTRLRAEHPTLRRGSQVVESVGPHVAVVRRTSARRRIA